MNRVQSALKVLLGLTFVVAVLSWTWHVSPLPTFVLIYLGVGVLLAIRIGECGLNK
jgi:hypothetical protein